MDKHGGGEDSAQYYNDGKPYLRYAQKNTPMSDYGHAMFAANPEHLEGDTPEGMANYSFVAKKDDPRVVTSETIEQLVKEKLTDWETNGVPDKWIGTDIGDQIENSSYTIDEIAGLRKPFGARRESRKRV